MKGTHRGSIAFLFAILLCFALQTGFSQAVYGNISGTVSDSSGARVAGATVTVTDVNKGTKESTTTNPTGAFLVTHLIPGTYSVRVEAPNFKAYEAKEVRVFADQTADLNPTLAAGGATETVEVTAEDVPVLKTDRADVATVFTERQVEDLPVINRNFTNFQLLTPGTQQLSWAHAAAENPQSSTQIFVNGQHFSGTSFQLDGTDNRDPILGIIVVNPNLDAVTEAKIATQNYDAEFGQAIAAVVTAQTKSGGNTFHGSAFEFRRNDELQARDPFRNYKPDAITGKFLPDSLRNQFGGSIGGPILKNKLFFFTDYQGFREKTGGSAQLNVPTALVRSTCLNPASAVCDLSDYLNPAFGINAQIYDPASSTDPAARVPFAGNIIPKNRLSPAAIKLLSLLPAPTGPGILNNYVTSGTGGYNSDGFDVRSDYNATSKLHVFGRYSLQKFTLSGKGAFDTPDVAVGGRGLGVAGFAGNSNTQNQSLAAGFDYSLSNNWLTDFRFGWFKYHVTVVPNGVGTSPATDAGIPGLNVDDFFTSGMPAFLIGATNGDRTGNIDFGYALDDRLTRCNCPLDENEDQFQFVNNWTNIRGNHQIKFGADIRYARNLRVPSDQHRAGILTFRNEGTGNPNDATSGVALASFLLGDTYRIQRYVSTATDAGERQKRWFFYGQDTWRATPKLTINYGLRWEIYFPQTVTGKDKGGFLDLSTGKVLVAGENGIPLNFGVENSLKNFAPRLGIAYQFTPKTVLRMGYGRSFDIGVFGSTFGHSVTQNLPVLATQDLQATNNFSSVFTLDAGPPAPIFPAIDSTGQITVPNGIFQRALRKRMQLPTVDAWNVTLQHQFTNTLSGEIAYVGNKGTHTFAGNGPAYNINQATIAGFTPGRDTNAAKLFFPSFGWTQNIDFFGNDASNNYHALQTKVEKRMSHGLQFLAHYTWSQAFNYLDEYYPIDPRVNYGPNDLNRRHVFVLSNVWDLPFGRGKDFAKDVNRLTDAFIGGWSINAVTNWSSGLPFSPTYAECSSDRDTGPCRPNFAGGALTGGGDLVTPTNGDAPFVQYFAAVNPLTNPSTDPCPSTPGVTNGGWQRPACGTFGTARRNSMRGPGFFNTDLSVFKRLWTAEKWNAQFRFNAYNVFNHRNNGTPGIFFSAFGGGGGNCVDCSDGGKITSLGGPMRQLEFGLRVEF